LSILLAIAGLAANAHAQAAPANASKANSNDKCVSSVQNRNTRSLPNGAISIPNIPVDQGFYRLRIECADQDATKRHGVSDFVTLVPNGITIFRNLHFGQVEAPPDAIQMFAANTVLTTVGQTEPLSIVGLLADGSADDFTTAGKGTSYNSSNNAVATVSANGVVTAVSRGKVFITALLGIG